ncbi:hypothetical protein [uncultured Fibrobacter sp.]|uniref:hypothetical protein n=1 Tax=uncultured Fibrobacter sp. TaxID=261512 RepID=UPI00261E51E5|nr:hypothetical protein [uncultured Fibrobacter sp.]
MFFLFAKIRYVILYVLVCGACCFAAYDPSPILPDTVFVEDSIAVEEGYSRCDTGAQSCIVVGRGCREEYFAVNEKIDPNEPEDSLLARVYGAEPLQDSSRIYGQWASNCKEEQTRGFSGALLYGLFVGGLSTAVGIGLLYVDYDYTATKILGRGSGVLFLATGIAFLSVDIIGSIIWLFAPPDERIQKYEEREKAWKLRVTPTINFNEPGGGLLLQLGF